LHIVPRGLNVVHEVRFIRSQWAYLRKIS
jgi:hypothetical protein